MLTAPCLLLLRLTICYHFLFIETLYAEQIANNQQSSTQTISSREIGKLQHLHVLFRHGDRSPIFDRIHNKEDIIKMWPSGLGQLTDIGIYQEFKLGRWIRSKYSSFIPVDYSASDFHMRSTDLDRTLMSAQSVAAGIFMNTSSPSPLVPEGLPWRPVPIHTVPQTEDILLSLADCPCLKVLQKVEMDSAASLEFENKHAKLFELLRNVTGIRTVDRNSIWEFHDILTCMRAHNFSMPSWYSEPLYKEIEEVQSFYWAKKFASTDAIVRLEIGVFLSVLVDHILAIVDGTPPTNTGLIIKPGLSVQHTMLYSAHDTDVTFILAAFGAYDQQIVPYSAAVLIELVGPNPPAPRHRYHLRLLYKRGYLDTKGEYVQFRACANDSAEQGCPLEQVLTYLDAFIVQPSQFDSECVIAQRGFLYPLLSRSATPFSCSPSGRSSNYLVPILVVSLTLVLLGALGLVTGLCVRHRLRSSYRLFGFTRYDSSSIA